MQLIHIFVWFKHILPLLPPHMQSYNSTYSFLNESQAQIAHRCLEPELYGWVDGWRKYGKRGRRELDLALLML